MRIIISLIFGILYFNVYSQKMEKSIIDGIEVEIHRNYYETGELNQEWLQTIYELHGYHKTFYFLTNKKQGIGNRTDWYDNENLKFKLIYTDSTGKNGSQITYYENSDTCLSAKYVNDVFYVVDFYDTERKQTLKKGNGYIETFKIINSNILTITKTDCVMEFAKFIRKKEI